MRITEGRRRGRQWGDVGMTVRARGVAVAVAVGGIALGAVLAPAATAAPAHSGPGHWAPADSAPIRPGVVTDTEGGGSCTSNFVFTSGDRTFIGQAAHCAGTGKATETNGCDSDTVGIGAPVTIKATDGTDRAGRLAYSSWVTMQANGETDPDTCSFNDFALVEIAADDVADVNPSLPVFGGPTGIDADGLGTGDLVYSVGNSPLRLGIGALGPKVGINVSDTGGGHNHDVYTLTPGVPGDSGSAFVDDSGSAFGVLSTLNLAPLPASNGVIDLAHALDYARANGDVGDVELALGTEPFDSAPAAGLPVPALPALPALGG
jgi:hypothetical protein